LVTNLVTRLAGAVLVSVPTCFSEIDKVDENCQFGNIHLSRGSSLTSDVMVQGLTGLV